jgi:DNA (cytosine-5)-methyltransferase 1
MKAVWFAEIEKFPSAVLAHHWPKVPNLGDMTMIAGLIKCGMIPAPELLVGGTPCQAFSVAGNRESLDDDRGQLTLEYVRLLNAIDEQREQPAVCVWENVPGVLNTKDNAFGCFLGELAGSGCELQPPNGKRWGNAGLINGPRRSIAWRILDAQFFGVAQRRRRVFVVASARDGFDPGQVLFEFDGVRRDIEPSREAEQDAAARVGQGFTLSSFGAYKPGCGTLRANGGDCGGGSETLVVLPITDKATRHAGKTGRGSGNGLGIGGPNDPSPTLTTGDKHAVFYGEVVRKTMPVEGERLQGFEDEHTLIPWRGKPAAECPDGPRYKAIGNSKAVPVVHWVGKRILDHLAALGDTDAN